MCRGPDSGSLAAQQLSLFRACRAGRNELSFPAPVLSKTRLAMILQKKWMIPRRTFLKGAGVMLGIPVLHAMGKVLPTASPEARATTRAASAVQAPVRMACIYFPNGVWEKEWFPKQPGADYELPSALQPLAQHKQQML